MRVCSVPSHSVTTTPTHLRHLGARSRVAQQVSLSIYSSSMHHNPRTLQPTPVSRPREGSPAHAWCVRSASTSSTSPPPSVPSSRASAASVARVSPRRCLVLERTPARTTCCATPHNDTPPARTHHICTEIQRVYAENLKLAKAQVFPRQCVKCARVQGLAAYNDPSDVSASSSCPSTPLLHSHFLSATHCAVDLPVLLCYALYLA